jgi:hypothetical protein
LLSSDVNSLQDLRVTLARGERVVPVEELPLVSSALIWLQDSRHPDGYWGVEDVAVTSLASLAIARWRPDTAEAILKHSATWLSAQAVEGAWETYWDTAVAVQALVAAGRRRTPILHQALEYLRNLDPADEQIWAGEVHHAAQILSALAVCGTPLGLLADWTDCIRKHLNIDAGVYVCSQAIHAMVASGTVTPEDVTDELAYLERYVTVSGRPSEGGLRDYAPAIQALSIIPGCTQLVTEKAGAITAAYTPKRAWYKEPRQTAWALIALHSAGSVTQIVIDRSSFNKAFSVTELAIPKGQRQARLRVAFWTVALIVQLEAVGSLVAFWNHTTSLAINGIAVGVLVVTIPISMTRLRQLLVKRNST